MTSICVTCWSTVLTVRVIECAELLAADLFKNADQTRQRITFGDVERSPGPVGQPSPRLWLWPLSAGAAGDAAQRVYAIASGMAARDQSDQGTGHALGRTETNLQ